MTFVPAIESGFRNYASFSGRSDRPAFWYWALFVLALDLLLQVAAAGIQFLWAPPGLSMLAFAVSLSLVPPTAAAGTRRLHDANRTGWHLLWALPTMAPWDIDDEWVRAALPLFGLGALYLVYLLTRPSDPEPNRYGTAPLHAVEA